ncbi:polysaccharide deacetylase family protein [Actinoplanes sp. NPDC051411]|uniref:polysaccharide deacetylase family protein n=1 Tax=Actinoplanes sp. NPDC051411 TaxID=3155522 RepID=UPI00342C7C0C
MRLSRSKKAVLVGTALLTIGVAGRAAAGEAPHRHTTAAPTFETPSPAPSHAVRPKKKTAAHTVAAHAPAAPELGKKTGGPAGSHLSTGTSAVALTFDDGPDPVQTPRMLKLLAQQHVHATFCLIGKNVRRHPELVRQIVAGGNTLCNHTWSHSLTIGKQPAARIQADLRRTNDAIHQADPKAKIEYFRAPGGNFTPRLVATAKSLGMTSVYWKVDPRDWDHPKGESDAAHRARVISTVEKHVGKGAIILSHDYNQPDTIAAYRSLIPWLRHRYRLVALPV